MIMAAALISNLIPDPRDLIDIPGFGRAEVALRACGLWDDGRDTAAIEWTVHLLDPILGAAECTVCAVDEKSAIQAGWGMHLSGNVRWDRYLMPDAASASAVAVEACDA